MCKMTTWPRLSIVCLVGMILLGGVQPLQAQEYLPVSKGTNPAFAKVVDDPKLPRVLIIGDSISIGYTPPLRELLQGKANIHRIPGNGQSTREGVERLNKWLGDSDWDLIHFNFGLHDCKKVDATGNNVSSPELGTVKVSIDEYEKNLRTIVERLQKTKAKLVWRNTTPIPAGVGFRVEGDEVRYNEVAQRVMKEYQIPTDDHWTIVKQQPKLQLPRNVHFTPEGSRVLAEQVAKTIAGALEIDLPTSSLDPAKPAE